MRFLLPVIALCASRAVAFCLDNNDATLIADNFAQLFSNYSKPFADEFLATDYEDQNDSVATLINNGTNCPIPVRRDSKPEVEMIADIVVTTARQPHLPNPSRL